MTKKTRKPKVASPAPIYERIRVILESARAGVARSVNTTQVVANWLIGREIVEEEQQGKKRAGYGEELIKELSVQLTADFGRGYSSLNLWLFKRFYLEFPQLVDSEILYALRKELPEPESETASRKSGVGLPIGYTVCAESWRPGRLHSNLSWTHYRTLLKVENPDARAFYEIEATESSWSARELERQINSLLFERLAKSRDKKGLMRLATQGQEISQPADVFKDPVVIEFLGLPESPRLVESVLETALIDNLQAFLCPLWLTSLLHWRPSPLIKTPPVVCQLACQ